MQFGHPKTSHWLTRDLFDIAETENKEVAVHHNITLGILRWDNKVMVG